jgi:SAM-dependent methyltransferase
MHTRRSFLPATGRGWLLPLYDPFVGLLGGDAVRAELLAQADIRPHHRILDIGCGTGSLLIRLKRRHPDVEAVGLDPDRRALARAGRKAARAAASVRLDEGFSDELPYPAASFDLVFSSFMFHHLLGEAKEKTLSEVRRVLKPGGALHLLDFAGQASRPRGIHGLLVRLLHAAGPSRHGHDTRILELMSHAGFVEPTEVRRRDTLFGRVGFYRASVRGEQDH